MSLLGCVIAAILVALAAGKAATEAKPVLKVTTPVARQAAGSVRVRYRVTDLGVIYDDDDSQSIALNDHGEAVVAIQNHGNDLPDAAYEWTSGHRTRLHGVSGYPQMAICGINDQGLVTGEVFSESDGAILSTDGIGIAWSGGQILRKFEGVGGLSEACAVAAGVNGEIVYTCSPGSPLEAPDGNWNVWHTFVWTKTASRDLGVADALAVNHSGIILADRAGATELDNNHPALYERGAWHDLPTPKGFDWAKSVGVNDAGDVVGYAGQMMDESLHEAFLYHDGNWIDLGPGTPTGINNASQVVGNGNEGGPPVLWWRGKTINVNDAIQTAAWRMTEADAINNKGQIAGFAKRNGSLHAVLLTPVKQPH